MNHILLSRRIGQACMLLIVGILFAVNVAQAQAQDAPISLQVALAKNTVMAGEPVLLHFKLTNLSGQEVGLKMGQNGYDWFHIQVCAEAGETMPAIPDHTYVHTGGFRGFRAYTLQPGESFDDSVVVTRYATVTQEGTYQVVFKANLTYCEHNRAQTAGALVKTYALPLHATAPDATLLQQHAQYLLARAREFRLKKQTRLEEAVVAALFSMPEEAAFASWRALLADPKSVQGSQEAVRQLLRLGTPAAADLIIEATGPDALVDSDVRGPLAIGLDDMYRTAGAEMRSYLEQQYRNARGYDSLLFQITRDSEEAARQMKLRDQQRKAASGK